METLAAEELHAMSLPYYGKKYDDKNKTLHKRQWKGEDVDFRAEDAKQAEEGVSSEEGDFNDTTIAALNEYKRMALDSSEYKKYNTFDDLVNEVLN